MQEPQTLSSPNHNPIHDNKRKISPLIFILLLLLLFAGSGYGLYSLAQINGLMAQEVESLKYTVNKSQTELKSLESQAQEWQNSKEKLQNLIHKQIQLETSLQQLQPHGNLHLQVSVIKDYITLAEQSLQISRDPELTQHYLQLALDILDKMPAANTQEIKNQIHAMLAQLQNIHASDLIMAQRNLILLQTHLQQVEFRGNVNPKPINLHSPGKNTFDLAWQTFIQSLKNFITIRHHQYDAPLRLPEEKFALLQNLNQQLNLAQLALTQRNPELFNACLQNLQAWIVKYADPKNPITVDLLNQIQQLKQVPIQLPTLNFASAKTSISTLDQSTMNLNAPSNQSNHAQANNQKNETHQSTAAPLPEKPTALAAVKNKSLVMMRKAEIIQK